MVSPAAGQPPASRASRGSWRLAGALFLLVAASICSLTGIVDGPVWWWLTVFIGALVLFSGAALRSLGVSRNLSPVLSGLILLGALTAIFGGGTGILYVIPSPASIARLAELAGRIAAAANQQSVPAQPVPELLFALALGVGVMALVVDVLAVAWRLPALSGLPVLGLFALPVILLDGGVNPSWMVLCIAAYVWVLRVDVRMRRGGGGETLPAVAACASVVVLALVVAVTAPGFAAGGTVPFSVSGSNVGTGVSSLIDLGRDLRRPQSVPVLSYTTTSPNAPYLKLTTLDTFTGATWTHTPGTTKPVPATDTIGPVPGLSKSIGAAKVHTTITVSDLRSPWLPVPYPAIGVHGQSGSWTWESADLTIGSRQSSADHQQYSVVSLAVEPTERQLSDASSVLPKSVRAELVLPKRIPAIITDDALAATAGADTEYDKAVALQNYFRNSGFSYSLRTPLVQGYDGDGLAVIATFLEKKAGYCVHFASAMAIMARVLGIPARVAIGYLPGSSTGPVTSAGSSYTVTSDELHSWPELYFPGAGWLAFEPTVGRGTIPDYAIPAVAGAGAAAAVPAGAPPSHAPATLKPDGSGAETHSSAAVRPSAFADDGVLVVLVVLLVLVLVLPLVARRLVRRRRRSRIRASRAAALTAWREVSDTARDLRMPLFTAETPRAFGARLASQLGDSRRVDALLRVRDAVERESYASPGRASPESPTMLADDLDTVVDALYRTAHPVRRMVARFAPVSLLPVLNPGTSGHPAPDA